MQNVKKRIVLCAIIGLVLALAVSGVIYAQYANRAPTPAELLSLGEQYLLDLDCEQALVQFLKVIEIEPMNERAYLGAAEASIGLGQMSEAIAILERGLIALPDSAALTEMLETLQASPNIESEALETDTELTSESGVDSGTITINGIIISNIEHYNDAYAEYSAMYSSTLLFLSITSCKSSMVMTMARMTPAMGRITSLERLRIMEYTELFHACGLVPTCVATLPTC